MTPNSTFVLFLVIFYFWLMYSYLHLLDYSVHVQLHIYIYCRSTMFFSLHLCVHLYYSMLNHLPPLMIYCVICYDFPFPFHFTLLFNPHSILFHSDHIPFLFPCHFSTRRASFPLSMTHKPWGLLPLLFPHCLTLPGTALWLVLTPFHLEAAPPLYFPSVRDHLAQWMIHH